MSHDTLYIIHDIMSGMTSDPYKQTYRLCKLIDVSSQCNFYLTSSTAQPFILKMSDEAERTAKELAELVKQMNTRQQLCKDMNSEAERLQKATVGNVEGTADKKAQPTKTGLVQSLAQRFLNPDGKKEKGHVESLAQQYSNTDGKKELPINKGLVSRLAQQFLGKKTGNVDSLVDQFSQHDQMFNKASQLGEDMAPAVKRLRAKLEEIEAARQRRAEEEKAKKERRDGRQGEGA